MNVNELDKQALAGLATAQRMVDSSHTAEYLALNLDERAKVDGVVRHVMEKIHSLMEGHGPFKMALRAALKPRYRDLLERIASAKINEREMTVVLAEVWRQTRAILDKAFDSER